MTADDRFASMGRIAPDAKPSHVSVPMPTAAWLIKPSPLDKGSLNSKRVEVEKAARGDYGLTVMLRVDGSQVTLMMSEDTTRELAAALLAAADWEPEAAFVRRADEILHPLVAAEPEGEQS